MKNQLSALIDGELEIEASEHVMTAAKSDGEVKEAWKHYHLIGDVMRDNDAWDASFSDRVMQALESEPTVLAVNKTAVAQETQSQQRKVKTPVFWSVAASVAAVMFVGLMVFELQLGGPEELTPVEIAQSVPFEYLQAHQSAAPSGSAYYMHAASYSEPNQQ